MQTQSKTVLACILAVVIATATASAQQAPVVPPTTPYGAPIGLEAAKKVMAAAEADAIKNNWGMAIAILDSTGHMVMLHKLLEHLARPPETKHAARFISGGRARCSRS